MRPFSFGTYAFNADGCGIEESDPSFNWQSQAIAIPRADGALDGFGSERSPLAARRYTVKFFVDETLTLDVDDQLDAFLRATQGLQTMRVIMRDGSYRRALMKCVNIQPPRKSATLFHLPVTATFEMLEPYWYSDQQYADSWMSSGSPVLMPFTNLGTAPLTKAIIRFDASHHPAVLPQFINNTNGYLLNYGGSVAPGTTWETNLGAQTSKKGNLDVFELLTLSANQIGLFRFEVGANDFQAIYSEISTVTITLIYRWMYY